MGDVKFVSLIGPSNVKDNLTKFIAGQFDNDSTQDVLFKCSDGQIGAHKSILVANSNLFCRILTIEDDVIFLPEAQVSTLKSVLQILYFGEIYANEISFPQILTLIASLDMNITLTVDASTNCDATESSNTRNSIPLPQDEETLSASLPQKKTFKSSKKKIAKARRKSTNFRSADPYRESSKETKCGICSFKSDTFVDIKNHYLTCHVDENSNVHQCPKCFKVLTNVISFHHHLLIVHRSAQFSCSDCPKKFKTQQSLDHHHERWHRSEKPFLCNECGESMSNEAHLKTHLKLHKSKFVCPFCERRFLFPAHLRQHEVVHTGERPYICPTCGKTFKNKDGMTRCERIHNGSYKPKPSQMVKYKDKEANFACDQCNYRSKSVTTLKRHVFLKHCNEKPFSCHTCKKAFKLKTSLKVHQKVHMGVAERAELKRKKDEAMRERARNEPKNYLPTSLVRRCARVSKMKKYYK